MSRRDSYRVTDLRTWIIVRSGSKPKDLTVEEECAREHRHHSRPHHPAVSIAIENLTVVYEGSSPA